MAPGAYYASLSNAVHMGYVTADRVVQEMTLTAKTYNQLVSGMNQLDSQRVALYQDLILPMHSKLNAHVHTVLTSLIGWSDIADWKRKVWSGFMTCQW